MDMLPVLALAQKSLETNNALFVRLGKAFSDAGYTLALVGGAVRDALLGVSSKDLDFTTDATPQEVLRIVSELNPTAVWDTGILFGTISAQFDDLIVEITTFRSDVYDGDTRKPEVQFGLQLDEDLIRRDFTINSIAIVLDSGGIKSFHDPINGLNALTDQVIDTPREPVLSFRDDPLRMLRAVRFASKLNFKIADRVVDAIKSNVEAIDRISKERIASELDGIMLSTNPMLGINILCETGLADRILPEIPALKMTIDEHSQHKDVYAHTLTVLSQAIDLEDEPDLVLRWAALMHDIGKPATRKFENSGRVSFHHHEVVGARMTRARFRDLKYSKQFIKEVSGLVFLHLRFYGYGNSNWTDSAVRRYVSDAGDLLPRLHKLVKADCTTRNKRKAEKLRSDYNDLERRIVELENQENLNRIRPDLDGSKIMEILGIPPGPLVGKAWNYLKELRLEEGELSAEDAESRLLEWWNQQSF